MIPDIIFGICPRVSHMPKFWQTCMIMYDNFMLIGEPWYCIPVDKLTKTGHKKSKRKQHVLELKSKKGFSVLLQPSPCPFVIHLLSQSKLRYKNPFLIERPFLYEKKIAKAMTDVNFKVWGTKMIHYKNAIKLDESGFKGKKIKTNRKYHIIWWH